MFWYFGSIWCVLKYSCQMLVGLHVVTFCSGGDKFTASDEAALSAFCSHIAVQFFPEDQSFESVLGFVRNQMTLPEGVQLFACSTFELIVDNYVSNLQFKVSIDSTLKSSKFAILVSCLSAFQQGVRSPSRFIVRGCGA